MTIALHLATRVGNILPITGTRISKTVEPWIARHWPETSLEALDRDFHRPASKRHVSLLLAGLLHDRGPSASPIATTQE
jgi:hypothetical protein